MPIPDLQELLLPASRMKADGLDHDMSEMRQRIGQKLRFTPNDLAAQLKSAIGYSATLAWLQIT